ncbi:tryptophan-rich sensory protein [Janibacter sp. GXQ6167]|uniref:tryptophan-rich sensory protein n=1 Tax=Janibacter sp. GXQ6167 TaxID=3240791 RepID=UPI003526A300
MSEATTSTDLYRRITVTVAQVVCVVGSMIGAGVFGGPTVPEAAGGALAADATYIAPAGPAFAIWSVIYVGLAAYTIWQWFPAQATSARHRATGWLAAATMVLNAAWLLTIRAGWLWVSVVVIVALVLSLGVLLGRLTTHPADSTADRVITDGTFGLYLGWVSVATCANIAATLVDAGVEPGKPAVEIITIVVLAVVAGLGVLYARALGGRIAVAGAMAWGLGWIAYGRWATEPQSIAVAIAAAIVAVAVVAVALRRRAVTA